MVRLSGWFGVLMLCAAVSATAQDKKEVTFKGEDTLKLSIGGSIDLDYVYRDGAVNEWSRWIEPTSKTLTGNTVGGNRATKTDDFVLGLITLRIDADLKEKASATVEFQNHTVSGVPSGLTATDNTASSSGQNGNSELGNDNIELDVEQAYVTLREFGNMLDSWIQMGVMDVTYDPRGRGNPLFFSPRRSESPWRELNRTRPLTERATGEPTGVLWGYHRANVDTTIFLLPSLAEGGNLSGDEGALGVWTYLNMDSLGKGSRIGLIGTCFYGGQGVTTTAVSGQTSFTDNHNQPIYTLGEAVVAKMDGGLEFFHEFYYQFGHAGHINSDSRSQSRLLDQHANSFTLGFRWEGSADQEGLWFEMEYLNVSGDNDQDDNTQSAFVSYENNNELVILESNTMGLDIDTNYWKVQLAGGRAMTVGSSTVKNNLELGLTIGYAEMAWNSPTRNFAIAGTNYDREGELGIEVDATVNYWINKSVGVDTTIGTLFSSDVMEIYTHDDETTTWLWTLGTSARF
jgi:hypothetical protein